MYEDLDGRTYSKIDSGTYYCIRTDQTYTIDPPARDDYDDVNIED